MCWEPVIQKQQELAEKLAVVNQTLKKEVELRRLNCQFEGTSEWAELSRRNEETGALNTKDSLDNLSQPAGSC